MESSLPGFTRGASVEALGAGESDSGRFYEQLIAARGEQLRHRHRQLEHPESVATTADPCSGQPEHPSGGTEAAAAAAAIAAREQSVLASAAATASVATDLQASGGAVRASFYEQLAAAQAQAARRHRLAGRKGIEDSKSAAASVPPTDASHAPPAASAATEAIQGTEVTPDTQAAYVVNAAASESAALPEQRSTNATPAPQSMVELNVAQTHQRQAQMGPAAAAGPGGSGGVRERLQARGPGDCTIASPPAAAASPEVALGIGPALQYGISRGNVGFRLLKKAGWQEGAGDLDTDTSAPVISSWEPQGHTWAPYKCAQDRFEAAPTAYFLTTMARNACSLSSRPAFLSQ